MKNQRRNSSDHRLGWLLAAALAVASVLVGTASTPVSADVSGAIAGSARGNAATIAAGAEHTCAIDEAGDVHCWGRGGFGRLGNNDTTNIGDNTARSVAASDPVNLGPGRTATAITTGSFHTCALLDDNTVKCWGGGFFGRLGNNANTNIGDGTGPTVAASDPVNLGPGRTATAITTGRNHTCALLDNNTIKCWGNGFFGQLGNNANTNIGDGTGPTVAASDPVNLGPGRTATAITTGDAHTCALLDNNTIKCWGNGFFGQLGNNTTTNIGDNPARSVAASDPVNLGAGRTATAITAGDIHTCALLDNNTIKCWGNGSSGRLGNNTTTNIGDNPARSVAASDPVNLGPGRTATAITAGRNHTCALLDNNTIKCWGASGSGQLGNNNTTNIGDNPARSVAASDPVNLGPGRTATAITTGNAHTCALLDNNTIKCWGSGGDGQLGNNNTTTNIGDNPARSVAASNPVDLGQAVPVAPAVPRVMMAAAGSFHTCALFVDNTVKCWGFGGDGQLGNDDTTNIGDGTGPTVAASDPVNLGPGRTATAITTGDIHTCALLDNNTIKCWGNGSSGRLGNNTTTNIGDNPARSVAASDPVNLGPGRTATAITAGRNHTCALLDNNTIKCWGNGSSGRLGNNANTNIGDNPARSVAASDPVDLGAGRTATAITTGSFHTCALLDDNTVKCWGAGFFGRLGNNTTTNIGDNPARSVAASDPVNLGPGRTATAITAGDIHTCALLDNNTVKCWGFGGDGQLGNNTTTNIGDNPARSVAASDPVNLGPGRTATAITAGDAHTCALLDNNTIKCWGASGSGQLGNNNTTNIGDNPARSVAASDPVNLGPGRTATAITTGNAHTCALLDNNTIKCWGSGGSGQLGNNTTANIGDNTDRSVASAGVVNVASPVVERSVAAGDTHSCALLTDGGVRCWGSGAAGRLGNNSTATVGDDPSEMGAALVPIDFGGDRTATAITAGADHSCAILNDGAVKCWGEGASGRLGNDSTANIGDAAARSVASSRDVALGTGRTARAISAGNDFTCAILSDGAVKCWGGGTNGRLGNDATTNIGDSPSNTVVDGPDVDLGGRAATAISTGSSHTCVILDDDSAKCWGQGEKGELGNDATTNIGDSPSNKVVDGPSLNLGVGRTATTISAGVDHTCAVLDTSELKCWGDGVVGALGNDSTDDIGDGGAGALSIADSDPVALGSGRRALSVTAGAFHTCAVLDDRSVKCWGAGGSGQLGTSTTATVGNSAGSSVADAATIGFGQDQTATAVDASLNGDGHTCAVLSNDTIKCWGTGGSGRLGSGSTANVGDDASRSVASTDAVRVARSLRVEATVAAPAAPTIGGVSAGDGFATVTWTAPGDNGGSAVSGYRIQSSTDGVIWTTQVANTATTATSRQLSLANATSYRFRVAAINTAGAGPWSAPSNQVTPNPQPAATVAKAAGQANPTASGPIRFTVTFNQPVTGFTAGDVTIGGTAGSTSATLSGSGSTYTLTVATPPAGGTVTARVKAAAVTNANGQSNPASNLATITFAPPTPDPTPTPTPDPDPAPTPPSDPQPPVYIPPSGGSALPAAGGTLAAESVLKIRVPEAAGAKTVFGNLASARAAGPGFATAYPCADGPPIDDDGNYTKADLNYNGTVLPAMSNRLVTTADENGDICFYTSTATALIVDINATADEAITPITNQRTDTRDGAGILAADSVLTINVPQAAGGKTVFGNLASANAAGPGFATAYPCTDGPPLDSDGNYTKADLNYNGTVLPAMSNRLVTTADANGDICFYTSTATALIVDINATADTAITPITNQRTDTRDGDGILPADSVLTINVPQAAGGKTVFGNLASANATGPGFATAYPCTDGPPVDSDGNYTKADLNYNGTVLPAMSNRLVTTADANGDICFYTSTATALIVDINATADTAITPITNQRTDTRTTQFS